VFACPAGRIGSLGNMTTSPEALRTFKNFAMSQSPPSYSPMRRRDTAEDTQFSESSPESAAADPAAGSEALTQLMTQDSCDDDDEEVGGGVAPVGEAIVSAQEDDDDDDDDASEDGDNAQACNAAASSSSASGAFVLGVSVPQNDSCSSEEDEAHAVMEGGVNDGEDVAPLSFAPLPVADATAAGGSSEEDEEDAMMEGGVIHESCVTALIPLAAMDPAAASCSSEEDEDTVMEGDVTHNSVATGHPLPDTDAAASGTSDDDEDTVMHGSVTQDSAATVLHPFPPVDAAGSSEEDEDERRVAHDSPLVVAAETQDEDDVSDDAHSADVDEAAEEPAHQAVGAQTGQDASDEDVAGDQDDRAASEDDAGEQDDLENPKEPENQCERPPAKKMKINPPADIVCGPSDSDMALVPVEAEDPDQVAAAPVIVAGPRSPTRDNWGALPEEAKNAWTVSGDSCSLEVNGRMLKLPRAVYDRLFAYQRQGVAWLWNLYQKGFGGILADEMGLGKTVQIAAFLACLKCTNEGSRFLLVVPPTLLEQWRRELKSWASDVGVGLPVHVMHGTKQERNSALRGMIARPGLMLTTYDLTRNCIDHLRAASLSNAAHLLPKKRKKTVKRGCRDDDSPSEAEEEPLLGDGVDDSNRPWDVVIVDEGHQIKNPSCLAGRALRKLEARSRFLLTGTPLQNKLTDLWALMDFCQPALLGNCATFERNFSDQIAKGSKRNATRFAVELKDHLARELKRLTAPHFLRRLKDEVLNHNSEPQGDAPAPQELPTKTDVVLWLNLTNAQVELYNLYLSSETVRRATSGKNGMEALRAIASLKKLTNHPLLCLPKEEFNEWRMRVVPGSNGKVAGLSGAGSSSSQPPTAGAAEEDMADGYDGDATQPAVECQDFLARLRAEMPGSVEGATLLSCKLRILSVLLPQLHKRGHRCLIFSQSTRMLDLIQACVLRSLGLKFLRIDGTIDPKDRDMKLGKFQDPESRYFAMCLSTQVGGVGLTITGADRVILCDPAWNPAMDAQAIDRVHRLGQQREVVVYRLIGSGAIEDKMFRLQVFKRSLAKTAMEQESQIRFFTSKDLKQLFDPPNQTTSTQSLMAEQLGTEALEHEGLLSVVAADIGSTDDPAAMPFWQSSDVLGFSDYSRLFMYLEQAQKAEEEAESRAKEITSQLCNEEYKKGQVLDGKLRANKKEVVVDENVAPEENLPLADE